MRPGETTQLIVNPPYPGPPRPPSSEPIRGSERCGFRRTLSGMGVRRSVVDYGLARRATLASVLAGRTTVTDGGDAHPYLLRAVKFHAIPTDLTYPIGRT